MNPNVVPIDFESQECAIKMGVASQTSETVRLLANKVAYNDLHRWNIIKARVNEIQLTE